MKPEQGTLVSIVAGPMAGKDAVVLSVTGEMVQVEVEIFGRNTTIDLPLEQIRTQGVTESPAFDVPTLEDALQRWKQELKEYRQPWEEWKCLEELVANGEFDLVHAPKGNPHSTYFLVGPRAAEHQISHVIVPQENVDAFRSYTKENVAFPSYLLPLMDLKRVDDHATFNGIAFFAVLPNFDEKTGPPLSVETAVEQGRMDLVQNESLSEISLPSTPTWLFQGSSAGAIFCVDANENVVCFSSSTKAFESIGSIDDFARYCLMSILAGQDWLENYQKRFQLDDFNLSFVPDLFS